MSNGLEQELSPRPEECRAAVGRILASKRFQRAARLKDFLLYIVDRQFAGAPEEMTEVQIGHRVFRRPVDYNPGEDSIVRTEARNLRQRLAQYYAAEGASEEIVLEIPRGAYVPVFTRRAPPARGARTWWWIGGAACLLIASAIVFVLVRSGSSPERLAPGANALPPGRIRLTSSDRQLESVFEKARRDALNCVYSGDPVGSWYVANWYHSTTEDRYAFYMRDVAHQSAGAAALGLAEQTHNMLRRFAAAVSGKRRWCGFWGINKDGFGTPIDYRGDSDFYYCLPANFDVLRTCYEQFLWTGDESYFDSVFSNFYDRTMTDYVAAWDRDGDGLVESHMEPGMRGRGSYYQFQPLPMVGGDLFAMQYRADLAYADIQERKGARGSLSRRVAEQYRAKARELRIRYNTEWWDAERRQFHSMLLPGRRFHPGYIPESSLFPLMFELTEEGARTESALAAMVANGSPLDAPLTYFPEVLFRYGGDGDAYRLLLALAKPGFGGYDKPERVFSTVGAAVTGLMGVAADAPAQQVETIPHLPEHLEWVRIDRLPVLKNEIGILHRGASETQVTNQSGPPIQWKASFAVSVATGAPRLLVDGVAAEAVAGRRYAQRVVSVVVTLQPGQTRTVSRPRS